MPLTKERRLWREVRKCDERDMACSRLIQAKRYVTEFPERGPGWRIYGISLYRLCQYPEAVAALRKALRLCPADKAHWVQNDLGHLYKQRGNFRRAEAWFRRAITSRPGEATAYIYLGGLFGLEGRLEEAEEMHRKAIRCEEGCIDEAFLNLGLILRAQGRFEEALVCFERALEIDPKYKDARLEIADVKQAIKLNKAGIA